MQFGQLVTELHYLEFYQKPMHLAVGKKRKSYRDHYMETKLPQHEQAHEITYLILLQVLPTLKKMQGRLQNRGLGCTCR